MNIKKSSEAFATSQLEISDDSERESTGSGKYLYILTDCLLSQC